MGRVTQPQASFPSTHIKLSLLTDIFSAHSAYLLDGLEIPEVSLYGRGGGTSRSKLDGEQQVAGEQSKRRLVVDEQTKNKPSSWFLSASISARESLCAAGRESACVTSIFAFGRCVGVGSGKAGIRQPLRRQLTYESSHPKRDI